MPSTPTSSLPSQAQAGPKMQMELHVPQEQDHEGDMARADLYRAAKHAMKLFQMIHDGQNLEAWVQAKITKSADYLDSIFHYMEYQIKFGDGAEAKKLDDITGEAKVKTDDTVSEEDDEQIGETMKYQQRLQALLESAKKKAANKKKPSAKEEKMKETLDINLVRHVLAEVIALAEELKKVGDKTTTHKGGTVTKTEKGIKHQKKDDYDGSDHSSDAQKKPSKTAMTGAERQAQKAKDKIQSTASKEYAKKNPGAVRKYVDGKLVKAGVKETVGEDKDKNLVKKIVKKVVSDRKMAEGGLPMTTVNGKKVPAFAADGKGKNDLSKGKTTDKNSDKPSEKDSKGLSAKQKKLPPGLQKAIAKKNEDSAVGKSAMTESANLGRLKVLSGLN